MSWQHLAQETRSGYGNVTLYIRIPIIILNKQLTNRVI